MDGKIPGSSLNMTVFKSTGVLVVIVCPFPILEQETLFEIFKIVINESYHNKFGYLFNIILKSLPSRLIFLLNVTEFRLKFLKLLLLGGELLLRGLDGLHAVRVLGHGHEAPERVPEMFLYFCQIFSRSLSVYLTDWNQLSPQTQNRWVPGIKLWNGVVRKTLQKEGSRG